MAEQYWIGGFFIDVSRNQITQNNQTQTIAPKALAVLTCLAENRGRVVSQETLLAEVWPNTIVSPNTLQRSIAQLRKALGDDGKVQVFIKTHSKQGYSLECDVRWQDSPGASAIQVNVDDQASAAPSDIGSSESNHSAVTSAGTENHKRSNTARVVSIIAGVVVLVFIGAYFVASSRSVEPTSPLVFDQIRSLTATDDKEFDANYTPDGKYIVFHRYLDKQCVNKIWAKEISTQKEMLLTKEWGAYGRHSFSKDGEKLVFLAKEACRDQVVQKSCFDLVSIDFQKALEAPQQPDVLLECKNSFVKKPIWMNNENITLMKYVSNRWNLLSYSMGTNTSEDLYTKKNGSIIDYAYSPWDDLIAVMSVHTDGVHYIEMLSPEGQILSSHPIEYPENIPNTRAIYPNFDPINKQLVFSTGRQLYTLSYTGKIAKVSMPFADRMAQPEFHPEGKKMLMIKGPNDRDVALLDRNQLSAMAPSSSGDQKLPSYQVFERSNLGDHSARFQPNGEHIAFWSERSGDEQIWISDGNGAQQLTNFPIDTNISGMDWAKDGNSILASVNHVLTEVFLDSSQKTYPLEYPVLRLYQWDSENQSAILLIGREGTLKLVTYDFKRSELTEISDEIILWALKSDDGQVVYKDLLNRFWRPGPVEYLHIKELDTHGARSKSFVMKGNSIYAINSDDQLWSYNLDDEAFKILGEVGNDADVITDVSQSQFLMTIKVSSKKEVVELSIKE